MGRRIGLILHGGTRTGNERYMVGLARELIASQNDLDLTVFYTRESTRRELARPDARTRFYRIVPEWPWIRLTVSLPIALRRSGVELVHGQYGLPLRTRTRAVITVHDVFVARRPDLYPMLERVQMLYRIPRALRHATRVIVPSEFTRQDLLELYDLDESKIRVIPLGVDARFRPVEPLLARRIARRYGLPERFLLFTGALQPRKNLERLIVAFRGLPESLRRAYPLVITGADAWMYDGIRQAAGPLTQERTVRFLGYVPDDDLPAIMSLASIFVFPSLSEGFGFPPLEAMSCGTCVMASRAGSLPEIVGDAGWLVNPLDVADIRRGLTALIADPVLRLELARRGLSRARTYSWRRTAEATASVYREALLVVQRRTAESRTNRVAREGSSAWHA